MTGHYSFSTRSVTVAFESGGHGFVTHVRFGRGLLYMQTIVKVSGKVCLSGELQQDLSGKEMMI